MKAEKYSYRIVWSEEDQKFKGMCTEFPALSCLASAQAAALDSIVKVVEKELKEKERRGEEVPEPISLSTFSGKFVFRTTPEIHRQLVVNASEAGVSLNRYVNSLIGMDKNLAQTNRGNALDSVKPRRRLKFKEK